MCITDRKIYIGWAAAAAPPDIELKLPPANDGEGETSGKGDGLGTEDRMEVSE